jgi:hypothetical protein
MYGVRAVLILAGFLVVAAFLFGGIIAAWKTKPKGQRADLKLIGVTTFLVLWFCLISMHYVGKLRFHNELRQLQALDVYSVQIGKHDFRDRTAIEEIVGALRQSRWFEVNHGGWGDSIPLRVRRNSGRDIVIDVAKYFREPGAIIGRTNPQGLGYSTTQAFAPELARVLDKYGVALPDCDTPRGRPCSAEQLNP